MDEYGAGEYGELNGGSDVDPNYSYDEYDNVTPTDEGVASENPPSNSWWQSVLGTATSTAGGILQAREAAKRNPNSNPPPGGAGQNPQAFTQRGSGMVSSVGAAASNPLVVVGLALAAAFVGFLMLRGGKA